jgi:hypothetical protein
MKSATKGHKPHRAARLVDRKVITDIASVLIRVAGRIVELWIERGGRL